MGMTDVRTASQDDGGSFTELGGKYQYQAIKWQHMYMTSRTFQLWLPSDKTVNIHMPFN